MISPLGTSPCLPRIPKRILHLQREILHVRRSSQSEAKRVVLAGRPTRHLLSDSPLLRTRRLPARQRIRVEHVEADFVGLFGVPCGGQRGHEQWIPAERAGRREVKECAGHERPAEDRGSHESGRTVGNAENCSLKTSRILRGGEKNRVTDDVVFYARSDRHIYCIYRPKQRKCPRAPHSLQQSGFSHDRWYI